MGGFTVQGPGGTTYTTSSSGGTEADASGQFGGSPMGMEDDMTLTKAVLPNR